MEPHVVAGRAAISVRSISLSELRGHAWCVVCDAPSTTRVEAVIAQGAQLSGLTEQLPELPLCQGCANRQRWARGRPLYARRGFVLVPGILTAMVCAFGGLPDPMLMVGLFVVLFLGWLAAVRHYRRTRAARIPVCVCADRGGVLELQVQGTAPAGEGTAPGAAAAYRTAGKLAAVAATSVMRPADDLTPVSLIAGTFVSAVIAGATWNGLYLPLRCTNGTGAAAKLVLDDQTTPLGAGPSTRYLRSGRRDFGLQCPDGRRRVFTGELTADDVVTMDVEIVCGGGTPKLQTHMGGGNAFPFKGI
jgi:hypothetical protein